MLAVVLQSVTHFVGGIVAVRQQVEQHLTTSRNSICTRLGLIFLFIGTALAIQGCDDTKPPPPATNPWISLNQGWNSETQASMHHRGFGSRIIPYQWFLHLERADDTTLLRDNQYLQQLGFIPTATSATNKDGLPIGLSRAEDDRGVAWVGLTCTACHTGMVTYQQHKILIDGGAGLIDFPAFEDNLILSLEALLAHAGKKQRFLTAMLGKNAKATAQDALLLEISNRLDYLKTRQAMNHSDTAYGHGRLDAFGQIFNTVAVELLGIPGNARPADAPVSYPFLWDAPHLDLVQWNGSAPNSTPGPLIQNVTTALAVFGTADVTSHSDLEGFPSSVDFSALGDLQDNFYHLQPPQWPTQLLGNLKPQLIKEGAKLYQDNCQGCHQVSQRSQADEKFKVTLVPLTEIGTDTAMADNFINSTSATGAFAGQKQMIFGGAKFGAQAKTVELVVHAAVGVTLKHPVLAVKDSVESYHSVYSAQANPNPAYYKARPLNGVWATAPFLHNGSVPTLYDLLLPPEQRPVSFYVGNRELDITKGGFTSTQGPHVSLFDTRLPGNHNQGHIYGTDLTDSQRYALIEYLKSI